MLVLLEESIHFYNFSLNIEEEDMLLVVVVMNIEEEDIQEAIHAVVVIEDIMIIILIVDIILIVIVPIHTIVKMMLELKISLIVEAEAEVEVFHRIIKWLSNSSLLICSFFLCFFTTLWYVYSSIPIVYK